MVSKITFSSGLAIATTLAFMLVNSSTKLSADPTGEHGASTVRKSALVAKKIQVLNFATFHMGETSDAHSTEFDEENEESQADAEAVAKRLAAFKPTIICVEVPREYNNELAQEYKRYLEHPIEASTYYGEVGLVAFAVARHAGLDRLYGIDHKLNYNYRIAEEIENTIDPATLMGFSEDPFQMWPELRVDEEALSLREKLRHFNMPAFLDFLIAVNADMLALAGTENGFEGADEAAKYYQRNLRIYSNLNRIPMTKDDRVLIISGGSHTAFLREFIQRSPKFAMVQTAHYL